jgi:hypothetical protein
MLTPKLLPPMYTLVSAAIGSWLMWLPKGLQPLHCSAVTPADTDHQCPYASTEASSRLL